MMPIRTNFITRKILNCVQSEEKNDLIISNSYNLKTLCKKLSQIRYMINLLLTENRIWVNRKLCHCLKYQTSF